MTNACKPRMRACVWLLVIGCGGGWSAPDASVPDARPSPNPNPSGSDNGWCQVIDARVSCEAGAVAVKLRRFGFGTDPSKFCEVTGTTTASCAAGCAVTNTVAQRGAIPHYAMAQYAHAPAALCTETPEAKVGDTCSAQEPIRGCIPTRAKLAADGTVIGHDYLTCDGNSKLCVAASPAPFAAAACDAATLAQYGTANANGVVALDPLDTTSWTARRACLLAWNTATQTIASSTSISCIGDWQCPAGALCDDQIAMIGTAKIAVCKPGPRGTLTPAMLAP